VPFGILLKFLKIKKIAPACSGKDRKTMETRSHYHSGKVMLAYTLDSYSWDHLYKMSACNEMISCFYNSEKLMLDKFLPVQHCRHHT